MQNDNAAFQYDPTDPAATAARREKAKMDMAYAASVKQHTTLEAPLPLRNVTERHSKDPEADEYDPFEHREVEHPLTNFDVLFHMMKASCGSGILAMPQAFSHAGYLLGLIGTAVIGFLCTYCVHILIQSEYAVCKRRKVPSLNYHEIARESFLEGPPIFRRFAKIAEASVHVSLGIYEVGACGAYTIFVANSIKQVMILFRPKLSARMRVALLLTPLMTIDYAACCTSNRFVAMVRRLICRSSTRPENAVIPDKQKPLTDDAIVLAKAIYNWFILYTEHIFLCIYQIGTMSVYTVFVANSFKVAYVYTVFFSTNGSAVVPIQMFYNVYDSQVADQHGSDIDIRLYMCMLLIPLILLNFVRNLKYLAPLSSFALVATVAAFGVTLKYVFTDLPAISSREAVGRVQDWPLFFGTVIFALEAIGVVVPLGNEMRRPQKYLGVTGVLNRGMVPIVLLYIFMGFFGYIKYGSKAMGSITLNLPEEELLAQIVKILIALAIFGTHPLQCYVVIDIIWSTFLYPRFEKHPRVLTIEYCVRAAIVTLAFLFAVAIPNLGPFISLVGALSLSVVGIMLPALIQLSTFWYHTTGTAFQWLLVKNSLLSIFAIIGLVSGTYASIQDIIASM
ncbi:LOW QUALITY PROTEIN: Proton-coupled amino acid transporter-like protein [Frankliniella fusca]|uniref:Proton-coupled amino acid transporter-like protein n=1 Tax=Frankliniella fusca TaxID=407009 RepID=A0AAE1LKZ5_9NEOP|nr:LOW QUALITY PROTEIN: Proton-coupled amino acid transporter-like protein [Frankliniella fusca]